MQLPTRALSIKQPWATLIVEGGKDIENRNWPTNYRGPVLIHASKKRDPEELYAWQALREDRDIHPDWVFNPPPKWGSLHCGGIIGVADIVDCVRQSNSPWFVGDFGFVLANARPLPFHACRGALGFWHCEYPEHLLH